MKHRFAWILPLLIGAALASLVWWQTSLPDSVHGAGLTVDSGLSLEDDASATSRGDFETSQALTGREAGMDREALAPDRGLVPDDSARLRARLLDATTGAALSGVRVVAYLEQPTQSQTTAARSTEAMRGSLALSPTSNEEGWVEFDLPPDQALRLSVRPNATTHQPAIERIPPLQSYELRDLTIAVHGLQYIAFHGRIRNRTTGEMVQGAQVRAYGQAELGHDSLGPLDREEGTYSDWDGRFEVDASARGSLAWVTAPGLGPTVIGLDAAHDHPQKARDLWLRPAGRLALDLRDDQGAGIADASVTISTSTHSVVQTDAEPIQHRLIEWKATTSAFGRAEFGGLPVEAPLRISISIEGSPILQAPPTQVLSPGEARELRWTVAGGTQIHGQLYGEADLPLRGQELWLLPASEEKSKLAVASDQARALHKTHTDQAGHFAFSGVPAGAWWIVPAVRGDESRLAPLARRFDVLEGIQDLEVRLEVFPALWVSGQIEAEDGGELGVHRVWLQATGVSGHLTAWSDESGEFRIGPVAPGLVEVGVYPNADSAGSPAVVCRAGEGQLQLKLSQGSRLRGMLASPEGGPLPEIARVLLTRPGRQVEEVPNLVIDGLDPGNYGLFVETRDGRVAWANRVSIGKGRRTGEAILELRPAGRVSLKGPGTYRLWVGGACVGFGELDQGESAEEVVPVGLFHLERPDRNKPAEELRAKPRRVTQIDLGRPGTGPGLAPRRPGTKADPE